MIRNKGSGWDGSFLLTATGPTSWLKVPPTKFKNVQFEAVWTTGSTAGSVITVQGTMATDSTAAATMVLLKSTAKGQKASTGTATLSARYMRCKSTRAGPSATKPVKVYWTSFTT